MMKPIALVSCGLLVVAIVGCSGGDSGSSAQEAKLHQELAGPPSLAGMYGKHPHGANAKAKQVEAAGQQPAAATTGQ
jgi:hypothetical protein